jgi:hypothetical protein
VQGTENEILTPQDPQQVPKPTYEATVLRSPDLDGNGSDVTIYVDWPYLFSLERATFTVGPDCHSRSLDRTHPSFFDTLDTLVFIESRH